MLQMVLSFLNYISSSIINLAEYCVTEKSLMLMMSVVNLVNAKCPGHILRMVVVWRELFARGDLR